MRGRPHDDAVDDGVPHALKFTTNYELPFGRGRRFGANRGAWFDGVAGGWSLNLTGRVQSGSILNFGNVRVVGMSLDELEKAFKIRIDPATKIVYTLPQDIIDNTIKAFSTSATSPTGYGALGRAERPLPGAGQRSRLHPEGARRLRAARRLGQGPIFTRFDLNIRKRFALAGRAASISASTSSICSTPSTSRQSRRPTAARRSTS